MPVDRSLIGSSMGRRKVVIERGPVAVFAEAVLDSDPIYRDPRAAEAAGLEAIPVPPTFPFVMAHWGAFSEIQPENSGEQENLFAKVLGPLLEAGGLLLHGEQEFEYFSPVSVGDVLSGESHIGDLYEKVSSSHTMTFVVTETLWSNESTGRPAVAARSNTLVRTPNGSMP